jgi:hypothetical protein
MSTELRSPLESEEVQLRNPRFVVKDLWSDEDLWSSMIGNGQGKSPFPLDHYLSWMTTNLERVLASTAAPSGSLAVRRA